MLKGAIRCGRLSRSFAYYVSKTPVVFDSSKQLTLYTYDDDNVNVPQSNKWMFLSSAMVNVSALSYYYYGSSHSVFESTASIVLSGMSTIMMLFSASIARRITAAIHLQSDGQTIHLYSHRVFSVFLTQKVSKKPIVMNISDISAKKGDDGFMISWKHKRFNVNDNGRILHPDLLFAVLKGMPILLETKK